jgi:hypothetical protein
MGWDDVRNVRTQRRRLNKAPRRLKKPGPVNLNRVVVVVLLRRAARWLVTLPLDDVTYLLRAEAG